jgi:hypothetical protein
MKYKSVGILQQTSENTTYNVIDALLHLSKDLWDKLVAVWGADPETFIIEAHRHYDLPRTVAYTYWHAIAFGMENGYPLQFHPGNEYFRRNPEETLDGLARRLP